MTSRVRLCLQWSLSTELTKCRRLLMQQVYTCHVIPVSEVKEDKEKSNPEADIYKYDVSMNPSL